MPNNNLIFVGTSETKSGQTRYLYYDPSTGITYNLAKPYEEYDYSKATPPSEEVKKKYKSGVYFVKEVKPTNDSYEIVFEQKPNPYVQKALEVQARKEMALNDALVIQKKREIARTTPLNTMAYAGAKTALEKDRRLQEYNRELEHEEKLKNPFEGYEKYYEGKHAEQEILNSLTATSPQVAARTRGVGEVDTKAAVQKALENYRKNQNKVITLSNAIYERFGLENKPYEGSPDDRVKRFEWAVKETAIDVAQGAIATITFPADIALLAAQREKFKDVTAKDIAHGVWEGLKSGELEGELAGGLLVSGAASMAMKSFAGAGTKAGTSVIKSQTDDIVKAGVKSNADDITRAGLRGKSTLDDIMNKFEVPRTKEFDVYPGAKTYITNPEIHLNTGGIKVEARPGYLRIEARGKVGEIYSQGKYLSMTGDLWKDKELVDSILKKLHMEHPDEYFKLKHLYSFGVKAKGGQKLILVEKPAKKVSIKKIGPVLVTTPSELEATAEIAKAVFDESGTLIYSPLQVPESLQRKFGGEKLKNPFEGYEKYYEGKHAEQEILNSGLNNFTMSEQGSLSITATGTKRVVVVKEITMPTFKQSPFRKTMRLTIPKQKTPQETSTRAFEIPKQTPKLREKTGTKYAFAPPTLPRASLLVATIPFTFKVAKGKLITPPPKRPPLQGSGGWGYSPRRFTWWGKWQKKLGIFQFKTADVEKKMKQLNKTFRGFKL